MTRKTIIAALALVTLGSGAQAASQCETNLRKWEANWTGSAAKAVRLRPRYNNDLAVLRRAALVFARHDKEAACERVVAGLKEMAAEYEKSAMENGTKTEAKQRKARRKSMLKEAKPVADMSRGMRLDRVIGSDVRSPQDKQLGEIEDIVSSNGQVTHVLIAHGGFLGIGENLVAIPWKQLRVATFRDDDGGIDERIFVLNMTEAQFDAAPTLKRSQTDLLRDETWRKRNDGYYRGEKQ